MVERRAGPRALFLFPDEPPQPDSEVCSGRYRNWLDGLACPYSEAGRMPWPEGEMPRPPRVVPTGAIEPEGPLRGWPEDERAPPCVVEVLGRLGDWRGGQALRFPPELGGRLLLKCRQMFLLALTGGEGG